MLDWPTAAVVLGTLGTITAAIIKIVPQRTVVQNSDGHKCATQEDTEEIKEGIQRLATLDVANKIIVETDKQNNYMHGRFHDVLDKMSPASNNTFTLCDRTNELMKAAARIENKLAVLLDRSKRGEHGSVDDL